MATGVIFLFVVFLVMLIIEVPIGIALSLAPIMYLALFTDFSPAMVIQSFFTYLDSFIFIAAPLFILGGKLAEEGGILADIFELTSELTKPLSGGIGLGFMICAILLAAMTGLSVAAAAALSVMLLPAMKQYHYPENFSAGMICAGGGLAMLIPPSLPLIIYGAITGTSVAQLFLAGFVPGLTMGGLFCVYIMYVGWKKKLGRQPIDWPALKRCLKKSPGPLMMPVVVLGAIYSGLTTPTEAAAIMVVYALIYGLIRKKGFVKLIPKSLHDSLRLTSMVWLLVGGAGILTKVLTMEQIPEQAVQLVLDMGLGPKAFLGGLFLFMLVGGCLMDGVSLLVVTMPLVFPILVSLHIDPIFFGIWAVVNLEIAVITPPVGLNLYAVSGVSGIPITRVFKGSVPFLIIMAVFLLFITFFPEFVTVLNY